MMNKFWTHDKKTKYEEAVKIIIRKLQILDEKYYEIEHCHFIRFIESRLKTEDSINKKLIKKRMVNTSRPVEDCIHDLAGVRCVCYNINQIYKIIRAFKKNKDVVIIKQKDYINNPKLSGYQSYHMVIRIDHILVELQLRTILMDVWASMATIVSYKNTKNISKRLNQKIKMLGNVCMYLDKEIYKILKQREHELLQ